MGAESPPASQGKGQGDLRAHSSVPGSLLCHCCECHSSTKAASAGKALGIQPSAGYSCTAWRYSLLPGAPFLRGISPRVRWPVELRA